MMTSTISRKNPKQGEKCYLRIISRSAIIFCKGKNSLSHFGSHISLASSTARTRLERIAVSNVSFCIPLASGKEKM